MCDSEDKPESDASADVAFVAAELLSKSIVVTEASEDLFLYTTVFLMDTLLDDMRHDAVTVMRDR